MGMLLKSLRCIYVSGQERLNVAAGFGRSGQRENPTTQLGDAHSPHNVSSCSRIRRAYDLSRQRRYLGDPSLFPTSDERVRHDGALEARA